MRIDVEVRSSGPGPRSRYESEGAHLQAWTALAWSQKMGESWTRYGVDYGGRTKRLCDGVAIIIRRA